MAHPTCKASAVSRALARPVPALLVAALLGASAAAQFGAAQELVPPPTSVLPASYEAVTGADLDADGDADAIVDVVLGGGAEETRSYANLGGNALALELPAPAGVAADLDGDGDADIVTMATNKVYWHENAGNGSFGPALLVGSAQYFVRGVRPEDVDGDGDLDILVWAAGYGLFDWMTLAAYFENLGGGAFVWRLVYDQLEVSDMASGDVDGDGDFDLVYWVYDICQPPDCGFFPVITNRLVWAENRGDTLAHHVIATNPPLGALHVVDLDGDGDLDVVGGPTWYRYQGAGAFAAGQLLTADAVTPVEIADLDRDGAPDLLANGPSGITWYGNAGNGTFDLPVSIGGSEANGLDAADWDGDGDPDVLASFDDKLVWYENTTPAVDAAQIVRLGSPANPAALLPDANGGPALGETWTPVVDHTSFLPAAALDLLALGLGPVNLPTDIGTALCAPAVFLFQGPASAPFPIAIPSDASLAGATLCFQAAGIDLSAPLGPTAALTNALDVTIGNH